MTHKANNALLQDITEFLDGICLAPNLVAEKQRAELCNRLRDIGVVPKLGPDGNPYLDDAQATRHAAVICSVLAEELTPGGSIECPLCHWGFAPSVIAQHIREKH